MPKTQLTLQNLDTQLPPELGSLLSKRDGHARLLEELPKLFPPKAVASDSRERRLWELAGLFYKNKNRLNEALALFAALYQHMLAAQESPSDRAHKGMPLLWISDCYYRIGFPVLAKRYLMLTLCEDSVSGRGKVDPEATGVYFRLVWRHGLPDAELTKYALEIYALYSRHPDQGRFPEWLLQQLDRDWITECPAPAEAAVYAANTTYISYLLSRLADPTGSTLEVLAEYILSCMPGCRTVRRQRSGSTDYDIVCSMDGFEVDFRSELGRYFVCECKDWRRPADFTTMAKFCRVLDSTKSRFGILFSRTGLSGEGKTKFAEREQLKVFQDRGMVIVVVDEKDLARVAHGVNFVSLLRSKYERVRLDLAPDQDAATCA
jgi:hypothetical protein